MSKTLRVPDYLRHILDAMQRIDRYTADLNAASFLSNDLVQDAVIRNIEIIGEASNNILRVAPDFAALHDDVPWLVMYMMRNRVSHGYHRVDFDIVWTTIERDLPMLRQQIARIAASLSRGPDQGGMAP